MQIKVLRLMLKNAHPLCVNLNSKLFMPLPFSLFRKFSGYFEVVKALSPPISLSHKLALLYGFLVRSDSSLLGISVCV